MNPMDTFVYHGVSAGMRVNRVSRSASAREGALAQQGKTATLLMRHATRMKL